MHKTNYFINTQLNRIMDDEKAKAIGRFLGYIFGLVIAFFIAVWFTIDAGYKYGWFAGGFHGAWVPFNWLRSLFDGAIHMKAPIHTSAYTVWWWIGMITNLVFMFNILIGSIAAIRKAFR